MGEALRRQRQDHLVDPAQAALAFGDDHRLEGPGPVPGDVDGHRPDIGDHRLGAAAVAGAPRMVPGRVIGVVADVLGHLALQAGLEDQLGQL